jgi:leader peptidase (prepilin peptidase)/N-methyltransferase
MTDVKEQIIPDSMIIALCLMGALLIWRHPDTRISSAGAGVGAGLFFFLLWALTRGKGMGFGDVKLAAALGLLLGYPRILIACYIAFLTGAIVGVILMGARRAGMKTRLAFGPFLLLGSIGSVLFGDIIWQTVRLYF